MLEVELYVAAGDRLGIESVSYSTTVMKQSYL